MTKTISIFLVDDHKIFTQAFELFIRTQDGFIWRGTGDGDKETLNNILRFKPDIVLLDYHLKKTIGLEILYTLRNSSYKGLIVLLTMNKENQIKDAVKEKGANGFVNKDVDGNDLLIGLTQLFLGEIEFLELPENLEKNLNNNYGLTSQEKLVADLVCTGLESEAIAEKLNISFHTVNTHRRRILSKTSSDNFIQVCLKLKD